MVVPAVASESDVNWDRALMICLLRRCGQSEMESLPVQRPVRGVDLKDSVDVVNHEEWVLWLQAQHNRATWAVRLRDILPQVNVLLTGISGIDDVNLRHGKVRTNATVLIICLN